MREFNNPFDNQEVTSYTEKSFGRSVRQRREQLGISLRQMAKDIGMSPVYLSDIERSSRPAPSGVVSKIDYMSALMEELQLTELQKNVFKIMAQLSAMKNINFWDNYFRNNPNALNFFIMALRKSWSNEKWAELYNQIAEIEK